MIRGLISRIGSLWRGVNQRADIEADLNEEFRLHAELRAQDLVRGGMSSSEAMRRARQEFGSTERYKEEARASRGLHRIDQIRFSLLDFKLGFRMLVRYPGLTLVGCLAIAVAIALGASYFEAINKWQNPNLPLAEGHRIVSIGNWDVDAASGEPRSLRDYAAWREQVGTITELGASVTFERNLITEDQLVQPSRGAEISASAFRLARVEPLLGRTLVEGDEQPSAPPVIVIGFSVWKARFASDPGVVGRTVKLGSTSATIVGVMPERFGFPVNHRVWVPLRVNPSTLSPRSGPPIQVFGRLATGVSLVEAQAELEAIGQRAAADYPDTHKNLRPRVGLYGKPLFEGGEALLIKSILYSVNVAFIMLLVVVCANVATLVFARTATRGWEITVRSALGASRARILTQLFVEALVLAGVSAILGLAVARIGLKWAINMLVSGDIPLPFWLNDKLSLSTMLYTALLTLICASIVGILPGLRVTKAGVQEALRREGAARSGLRFGGFWTGVIVVQVAITVAFLPLAAGGALEANRFQKRADALQAHQYLSAGVAIDREGFGADSTAFMARSRAVYLDLERRLLAEPGVERLAFAERLPGMDQFKHNIEVDTMGMPATPDALRRVTANAVSPGFFETFRTSIVAGRGFELSDAALDRFVVVNQSFVHHVLGDRNPIGQRVRYRGGSENGLRGQSNGPGRWYEIIGTIKDFGWVPDSRVEASAMYHPLSPSGQGEINLAMLVRGDPETLAPRLRTLAASVDPTLRLYDVAPLSKVGGEEATMNWALTTVGVVISIMVLLLSATGIHSLMAFTVARRSREIGIRAALGAQPGGIVAAIFSRAFMQLTFGVLAGSGLAALWGLQSFTEVALLLTAVAVMMLVGLIACAVPLRRALRIDPTEALRMDG